MVIAGIVALRENKAIFVVSLTALSVEGLLVETGADAVIAVQRRPNIHK